MSFRTRLILCFALIVLVPAAVATLGLTRVAGEWSAARDDAGLAASAETALEVFADKLAAAAAGARKAGRDEALAASLRSRDSGGAQKAVDRLAHQLDLAALSVQAPSGRTLASKGATGAPGAAEVAVRGPGGSLGEVRAATLRAARYVERVSSLTGGEAALLRGERVLASTVDIPAGGLPEGGGAADVELPPGESRAMTAIPNGAGGAIRVAVLEPRGSSGFATSPPLLIAGGLALLLLAVLFVVLLVRALQGQVREMLTAARRIGGGDFSRKVPVTGDDELAGLAREFNTMSDRLEDQMGELRRQRAELEHSVMRTGEALAAGPDRGALLEVAADVALAACDARSARVMLTGPVRMDAELGDVLTGELGDAVSQAEEQALRGGVSAEAVRGSAFAAAEPLSGSRGARGRRAVMTLARTGRPFNGPQREMLRYLAGQAAVSLENIELHELVSEGSITDELTGLADSRHLRELLEAEVERAQRFGHELSMLVLSVDHRGRANQPRGPDRDRVMREVARILDAATHGVGEPGRWGTEGLAVILPETGLDGTLDLAERIRIAIERAAIPLAQGAGTSGVTVSIGIAALARFGGGSERLVASAGAALERARARGGNRTEVASSAEHAART